MNLHILPSFNIDRLCKTASVLLFLVNIARWMQSSLTHGVNGKLETRAVIKIQGKHAVSRTVFFDWPTYFREGTTNINDKEGRGWKKKITPTLVTLVANALENARLLMIKPLETKFDVSYGTMHTILTRVLKWDSKK